MNLVDNAAFRIGQWRVNPALDEISRDGTTVKLEPRTMRVLMCLAEHPGQVITVDQLLDAVWKDLVVTQYSVYQAVATLRRALGDDSKNPTYIASVRSRGYRLVAPVEPDTKAQDPVTLPAAVAAGAESEKQQAPVTGKPEHTAPAAPEADQGVEHRLGLRYGSMLIALLVLAGAVWWFSSRAGRVTPAAFSPPPHSIAVLPFVNISGDKDQEYFSEGLTEELLDSLSRINELQVAAHTSSFSFQGAHPDIATVAHKLNVGAVLEGSVRRSGQTIRITTQLINAVTGFHLWSKSYDRDLGDVLKLQTEIATAVAEALKVTLLGDVAAKIELGGTRNPAAFDAYLRAAKAFQSRHETKDLPVAIAAYTEAIGLDPNYALAFAGRSVAVAQYADEAATGAAMSEAFAKAESDARRAIALAPELAQAHAALAYVAEGTLDFARASKEYERALALAPGNAQVLRDSGQFAAYMGHFDAGIAAARHAVVLDPLDRRSHSVLGRALYTARRYGEAATAYADALSLNPGFKFAYGERGLAFYGLGDLSSARASCESQRDYWGSQPCLAAVYDKLGRRADAEAELAKMKAAGGASAAYQYATIYAQWGDRAKALEWLDTAMRARDPGLVYLKTDLLMDPLRQEPRFKAIERELKFPN